MVEDAVDLNDSPMDIEAVLNNLALPQRDSMTLPVSGSTGADVCS